jgi:S1-C subfamily serine protease
METSSKRPFVSCSPWALILVLLVAALYLGSKLAAPLLTRMHDPQASPRAILARGDLAQDEKATIDLFRQASPSVVHIGTTETVYNWRLTPFEVPQGTGSGFVWDDRGYIVTNFHVIKEAHRAFVYLEGRSAALEARYVGGDPDNDIAVLKIDPPSSGLHSIPIGTSKDLQVGQKVFAIGNPFGLDHTLTTGVISGLCREISSEGNHAIRGVIQTDAAINPGNSGGPLLDSAGRLIGMNAAIATPPGLSAGGGFNVGVGFAIPVDTINQIAPSLIRNGSYTPPRLGIVSAPGQIARSLGVDGVVVQSVEPGGGAESAGLHAIVRDRDGNLRADVITAVDGKAIADVDDLYGILRERKSGDVVRVEYVRDGRKAAVDVTVK